MEVIKTAKVVEEITGYKAFDGMMFKVKEECEKYENTAKSVIVRRFKEITIRELEEIVVTGEGNNYFGAGVGECWYDALISISNEDDLRAAQMYQECVENKKYPYKRHFTKEDIGKELLVSIGENHNSCYIYGTIDECIEKFRLALMKFKETDEEQITK